MKFILGLFLFPVFAFAGTIFDGYDAFYATLSGQLFRGESVDLKPYFIEGDNVLYLGWTGIYNGRKRTLKIRDGILVVDGEIVESKMVHTFPDEMVNAGDLGIGSKAYFAPKWVCVENTPISASGTAVRHKAVYLVQFVRPKLRAWKLPSLFGSCKGITHRDKKIIFNKVTYRYQSDHDNPVGVLFNEYLIQDKLFSFSGHSLSATFVEPDNVYQFFIDKL